MNGTVETTSRPEVASKTSEKKKSSFKPFEKKTENNSFRTNEKLFFSILRSVTSFGKSDLQKHCSDVDSYDLSQNVLEGCC